MYDQKAIEIAEQTFAAEAFKRRGLFARRVGEIKGEFAKHGAASSSGMILAIADACGEEIEDSTKRLWEILHRALTHTGVEADAKLAARLNAEVKKLVRGYCLSDAFEEFRRTVDASGIKIPSLENDFQDRVNGAQKWVSAEIELFARSLDRSS
jgi:hypothetical protein